MYFIAFIAFFQLIFPDILLANHYHNFMDHFGQAMDHPSMFASRESGESVDPTIHMMEQMAQQNQTEESSSNNDTEVAGEKMMPTEMPKAKRMPEKMAEAILDKMPKKMPENVAKTEMGVKPERPDEPNPNMNGMSKMETKGMPDEAGEMPDKMGKKMAEGMSKAKRMLMADVSKGKTYDQ